MQNLFAIGWIFHFCMDSGTSRLQGQAVPSFRASPVERPFYLSVSVQLFALQLHAPRRLGGEKIWFKGLREIFFPAEFF